MKVKKGAMVKKYARWDAEKFEASAPGGLLEPEATVTAERIVFRSDDGKKECISLFQGKDEVFCWSIENGEEKIVPDLPADQQKKDPNVKRSYSGPESGKGAAYAFDGSKEMGKGTLEILDSAPGSRVTMSLHMVEPFEVRNRVDFTLEPKAGATEVTWTMQGAVPYFAKIIHLFVNMDRMVGTQFEAGLASLKTIAEKTP